MFALNHFGSMEINQHKRTKRNLKTETLGIKKDGFRLKKACEKMILKEITNQ